MSSPVQNKKLDVKLVTPTKVLSHVECDDVFIPTSTGVIQVLPQHCPLVTEVIAGVFHYTLNNKTEFFSVAGGVAYIADDKVTLLADVAEDAASLDLSRAQKSLERARKRLSGVRDADSSAVDVHRAMEAEKRARARIETVGAVSGKS